MSHCLRERRRVSTSSRRVAVEEGAVAMKHLREGATRIRRSVLLTQDMCAGTCAYGAPALGSVAD